MSEENEEEIPKFESYDLLVDGKTYTVLEPEESTIQRVEEPSGQVIGVPVSDSSLLLTESQLADHLTNPPPNPLPVRIISKLKIMRKFKEWGKWDTFKIAIAALGYEDEWLLSQSIQTDDILFTTAAPILKSELELSDLEFQELLSL